MDGELSVRDNSGDDTRGQCHGKTLSGGRGPGGLTCATNPLCDLHLRTPEAGERVCIRGRGAILCGQPWLGDNRKRCQLCCLDTCEMRCKEHCVGKQTRATVRHC